MKKMICIIGLILMVGIFVSGCADRQPQQDAAPDDTVMTAEPTDRQDEAVNVSTNISAVTQEELDQLKADIEKLEAEDLGGLSNE